MKSALLSIALLAAASVVTNTALAENGSPHPAVDLTTVMNSIPDIIFYKDLAGVYRGGNSAWAKLTGQPLDQIIGKTDFDLFPEELATSFRTYDQAMLASGQSRSNQEWVVYPDGQRVLLETVKTPWLDANGKVLGLVGICHDITARQQTHSD
tara:strand:+ start:639 stop:1097 length:459 start_codon:yes stop_codon:yes gene_type:complete